MGERYLVSGVQLGLLIATPNEQSRKELVDTIIDKQFVGKTNNTDIVEDAESMEKLF